MLQYSCICFLGVVLRVNRRVYRKREKFWAAPTPTGIINLIFFSGTQIHNYEDTQCYERPSTAWSSFLSQNRIIAHLVEKLPIFMELAGTFPPLQQPLTDPCPKPHTSGPRSKAYFFTALPLRRISLRWSWLKYLLLLHIKLFLNAARCFVSSRPEIKNLEGTQ